ncbi:MAG: polysaccharide deacetylase family protein [Bacteroidales bacterium]|nr:polysaccharide deacetylase family protein [Bacteroidales bacterium]
MLRSLIKLSGKRLLLPLYHVVSDSKLGHIKNLYSVRTTKQFVNDIDFILKYYEPINVETIVDSINNQSDVKRNSVLFTFDDGLKEVYDIIAPILKQKGIPAVFFVNSDFVDNKKLFYRYKASLLVEEIIAKNTNDKVIKDISLKLFDKHVVKEKICEAILNIDYNNTLLIDKLADKLNYDFDEFLEINQPYLSKTQIESLISQGFSVGAHSTDHPEYYKISFEEQIKQTAESTQWIKSNFNPKYNLFAFPFTDYNVSKRFFETIHSSENPRVDLSFGCAGLKDELYSKHLQRIPIEELNLSVKQIITKEYLVYLGKKLIRKNVINRG